MAVVAALDFGTRRIGIAVSDDAGIAAHPLCTIERRSMKADLAAIRQALGDRKIDRIVVGLPLNMDGSEGPMARHARNFAARLAGALGLRVEFHDERLSSFEAEDRIAAATPRRRHQAAHKLRIDAVAAAVILEGWLAARRPGS